MAYIFSSLQGKGGVTVAEKSNNMPLLNITIFTIIYGLQVSLNWICMLFCQGNDTVGCHWQQRESGNEGCVSVCGSDHKHTYIVHL